MAEAYTPGLIVTYLTTIRKERRLPLEGNVIVKLNEKVKHNDIVAETEIPGDVRELDVARIIGIHAGPQEMGGEQCSKYMLKNIGDVIKENETIARLEFFFGLIKKECNSPMDGTIENISDLTGKVLVRAPSTPFKIKAYIPGIVKNIDINEGVIIETNGSLIQGIFGIGGETNGCISILVDEPSDILSEDRITIEHKDKIIVGGKLVTLEALQKASKLGVNGIIVGGIMDTDLINFLGYDIGVAITGQENINPTLIITEGYGELPMSKKTFSILKKHENKMASINGSTQIRAGVIRPEIIIPLVDTDSADLIPENEFINQGLTIGMPVRIIREPYFGLLGRITKLTIEPQLLETGSKARVLELELENGNNIIVPRANIEMIDWEV